MNKRTSYKLLTKTTLIYLIFTLTTFLLSAVFLTNEADEYIDKELEGSFNHSERKIYRSLERNRELKSNAYTTITRLDDKPDSITFVSYVDTLIADSESGDLEPFRKKTFIMAYNNTYYKISIAKSIRDFYRLRDDIFEALIPAFLILALFIVIFNYFMSGFIFKPFNKILYQMRAYKVGKKNIDPIKTSTTEFIRMRELFSNMVKRIDEDYDNLKEYTENMAHEIQTPLTVIRNKLENLLSDEKMMQQHGKDIKVVFDETNYLSKLGQSLNLITKIENREYNDIKELFSKPIIEKHLEAISESIQLKNLKVETHLSSDHKIFLDPVLLDIILKNLIRNAIQYADNSAPLIITTEPGKMSVSNHGSPLPFPEEHLFMRFQHNNESQKSLGLGLAIVKKICDLNNLLIQYSYSAKSHHFSIENILENKD